MGRRREDGEGTVKREGAPLRAKTRRGRGGIAGHARGRPGDVPRAHRPGTSGHATREAFSPPAPPTWARWQPPPADTPETRHTAGDAPVRAPGRAPPRSRDPTPHRSLRSRQRAPPHQTGLNPQHQPTVQRHLPRRAHLGPRVPRPRRAGAGVGEAGRRDGLRHPEEDQRRRGAGRRTQGRGTIPPSVRGGKAAGAAPGREEPPHQEGRRGQTPRARGRATRKTTREPNRPQGRLPRRL